MDRMRDIKIAATKSTPEVKINASKSSISIKGRSIPEDATKFYHPVLDWLEKHASDTDDITLNLYLEYINSSSKKMLIDIFANASELNTAQKHHITIHWQYDDDDEEMKEVGEVLQKKFNLNFSFEPIHDEEE